jgi:hypothetical protein
MTPLDTLIALRAEYPRPFASHAQRVEYLDRVASIHGLGLHRDRGESAAPQPGTGIRVSTDILVEPNGAVYDALIDEETPCWRYVGPIDTMANYVEASGAFEQPAPEPDPGPSEPTPGTPPDPRIDQILAAQVAMVGELAGVRLRLATLESTLKALTLEGGNWRTGGLTLRAKG